MSDFIQNAVNAMYQSNELMALKAENARLKADVNELADGLKLASEVGIKVADEVTRLQAENDRLKTDLNKMTKTPDGVDYVEVDVSFWTKSGSRLPQSYSTFWSNDKGVQS